MIKGLGPAPKTCEDAVGFARLLSGLPIFQVSEYARLCSMSQERNDIVAELVESRASTFTGVGEEVSEERDSVVRARLRTFPIWSQLWGRDRWLARETLAQFCDG